MTNWQDAIFLVPPVAFLFMLLIGYGIYAIGGKMAFKAKKTEGKLASYACGEDIPGMKLRQNYDLFHVAFFFTMLHVGALIIATLPNVGEDYAQAFFMGLIYLMGLAFVIVTLLAGGADRA